MENPRESPGCVTTARSSTNWNLPLWLGGGLLFPQVYIWSIAGLEQLMVAGDSVHSPGGIFTKIAGISFVVAALLGAIVMFTVVWCSQHTALVKIVLSCIVPVALGGAFLASCIFAALTFGFSAS